MLKKPLFLFIFVIFAIITYSQPKATVQLSGGIAFPLSDLEGTFGESRAQFTENGNPDSNSYFMKSGFCYGIGIKIPINRKTLPVNFTGSLAISSFSQSKEYNENGSFVEVTLKQNITSFNAGIEYTLAKKKTVVNPYAGVDITLNLFSGSYLEDYVDSTESFTLNNTVRGGIQLNAGVEIVLHNNVGLNFAAKYSISNLFGKSYVEDTRTKYNLNDAQHTINGVTWRSRTIAYLQVTGGFSFYFGR